MKEIIFEFFKSVIILTDTDVIKMFWFYAIWFVIAEFIIYTIEKLVGFPTVIRWYDLALLSMFTFFYALNTYTLVLMIKRVGDIP